MDKFELGAELEKERAFHQDEIEAQRQNFIMEQ